MLDSAQDVINYFSIQTQPLWERDDDLEHSSGLLPSVAAWPGAVPELRKGLPSTILQRFGISREMVLRGLMPEEIFNLVRSIGADGQRVRTKVKRSHTRGDGTEYEAKNLYELKFFVDPSVAISAVNAETQDGRQAIYDLVRLAGEDVMYWMEERAVYHKKLQSGNLLWFSFVYHATRTDEKDIFCPAINIKYVVPNILVSDVNGKNKALAFEAVMFQHDTKTSSLMKFNDALEIRANDEGIKTSRNEFGHVVFTDVPNEVSEYFFRRRKEVESMIELLTYNKAMFFEKMSPSEKSRTVRQAMHMVLMDWEAPATTQTLLWRNICARLGWRPTDLVLQRAVA